MKTQALQIAAPQNPSELKEIAQLFVASGYFKDIKDVAQAAVKILAGQELGISPFAALKGIHIVDGKPEIAAHLMGALIKRSGKYNYRVLESSDDKCSLEFSQHGDVIGQSVFTHEQAKKAGLAGKGNWAKYTAAMLYNRALSQGARMFCPDIFLGAIYDEGELSVYPTPEPAHVTQAVDEAHELLGDTADTSESQVIYEATPEEEADMYKPQPVTSAQRKYLLGMFASCGVREGDKRELLNRVAQDLTKQEATHWLDDMKTYERLPDTLMGQYVKMLRSRFSLEQRTVVAFLMDQFDQDHIEDLDADDQHALIDWLYQQATDEAEESDTPWQRAIHHVVVSTGYKENDIEDWICKKWGDDTTAEPTDLDENIARGILNYKADALREQVGAFVNA
jgi:hypothetical protein